MPVLELESTLTDRYQTTVPDAVRRALRLSKRDKIRYIVQEDSTVLVTRSRANEDDPVLDRFLTFLADDMAQHPQRIRALDQRFARRMKSLVKGVKVDLDAALSADGE